MEANRVLMEIREECPLSIMNTFLGIGIWGFEPGEKEPFTIKELSEKIDLPYTTVSRHLRYLGDYERFGVPGAGLVATEIYPLNRRQKIVFLTERGRKIYDRVAYMLGDRKT
jgi:DNA-binding MarR family transcriptional regulator